MEASEVFLRRLQESSRATARKKLETDPKSLSEYERQLLGLDYEPAAPRSRTPQPGPRDLAIAALCPKDIVFRDPFLKSLNDHVVDLVVRYGIAVKRRPYGSGGAAYNETREISIPPITNESSYCTALHEIGHIVDPDGDSRQYKHVIMAVGDEPNAMVAPGGEIGAWIWAYRNALKWTLPMQEQMCRSLKYYASQATPDERVSMAMCIRSACLKVTGPTWTFGQLESKCAEVTRG
jgi:hypothetical protein